MSCPVHHTQGQQKSPIKPSQHLGCSYLTCKGLNQTLAAPGMLLSHLQGVESRSSGYSDLHWGLLGTACPPDRATCQA